MTRDEMQSFVEEGIPLVKHAGFVIRELNDREVLVAGTQRLNHNHHNTVFGGSISTILILSSWLMLRHVLDGIYPEVSIVIERHCTDYLVPVDGDFTARCVRPSPEQLESLKRGLEKKGRGRIDLSATLHQEDSERVAARFSGTFFCRFQPLKEV